MMLRKKDPDTNGLTELAGSKIEDVGFSESVILSHQSIDPLLVLDADYSPDGKWIVFKGWPKDKDQCEHGEHNIYKMPANGSVLDNLTTGGSCNFDPAWRPIFQP